MKLLLLSLLFIGSTFSAIAAVPTEGNNADYFTNSTNANCDAAVASNGFTGGRQCSINGGWSVATDIVLAADTNMTISKYTASIGMNPGTTATSVRVRIYNNANGKPGAQIATQTIVPTSQILQGSGLGMNFSDVLLDLEPVVLSGSAGSSVSYWIAIQVTTSNGSTAYMETANVGVIGAGLAFSDGGSFIIPDEGKEGVYALVAECSAMDAGTFPSPYCGPLVYGYVEPITLVQVAGINNPSSNTIGGTPSHQDFCEIVGEMQVGQTYEIVLKGNTAGNYGNYFTVFIDWNQNAILNNIGEVFNIESPLTNSTGIDDLQITAQITVPDNATLGQTRMRVIKVFGNPHVDPCTAGSSWGQVEDYTINITESLGVTRADTFAGFSYFPNPSTGIVNLKANKSIENITLYNLVGQQVFDQHVNTTSSVMDFSHLPSATYIMKVTVDGHVGTYKFIKN